MSALARRNDCWVARCLDGIPLVSLVEMILVAEHAVFVAVRRDIHRLFVERTAALSATFLAKRILW